MAEYEDWEPEFQELWNNTPGTEYIDDFEQSYAQQLFDLGFGHTAAEYDSLGLSKEDVWAAREEFFDYMGMADDQFDWAEWREFMGYE